ncbi:fibroin heavy chain-like [Arapaima gigas]
MDILYHKKPKNYERSPAEREETLDRCPGGRTRRDPSAMLGHMLLQTLVFLGLAQNTLQGGVSPQVAGGLGRKYAAPRGAAVPLGLQGGPGFGGKPNQAAGETLQLLCTGGENTILLSL